MGICRTKSRKKNRSGNLLIPATWLVLTILALPVRGADPLKSVNLLLMDNSRSVPVMDPGRTRQEVLAEILKILDGCENRLILFGGAKEIVVDDPSKFINDGWHTDYYYAFRRAVEIRSQYSPDRDVKIIFITDGLLDPSPGDYPENLNREKTMVQGQAHDKTLILLEEHHIPTFVILLGGRYDLYRIEQISIAANGLLAANPLVEKAAAFLKNNGLLFRQFIYKVPPRSSVKEVKQIMQQIQHRDRPWIEILLAVILVLAVMSFLFLTLRSFPAPGDRETIELVEGVAILIGTDGVLPWLPLHFRRPGRKGGLQAVTSTNEAVASISFQQRNFDFSPRGLVGVQKLDPASRRLLEADVRQLPPMLDEMEKKGNDEEMIAATNLRYYCSNLDVARIKTIIQAREMDRLDIQADDFLKAKVYASLAPDLLEELTEHRVSITIPGRNLVRAQVLTGQEYLLGRYRMRVVMVNRDSKFSARVTLQYVKVPSPFGLKKILPLPVQQVLRLRGPRTARLSC